MKPPIVVAAAFIAFALIHSITVSRAFKKALARIVGEDWMRGWYRLCFTILSITVFGVGVYVYYLQPDEFLYRPGPIVLWACHAVQFAGVLLMVYAMKPFDAGFFSGVRQTYNYTHEHRTSGDIEGIEQGPLVTTGVYGLVRHPMYTAGIMMMAFEPNVTVNCLVVRVLACLYFIWGGFIEERRFASDFGEDYEEYRKRVPMFNIVMGVINSLGRMQGGR